MFNHVLTPHESVGDFFFGRVKDGVVVLARPAYNVARYFDWDSAAFSTKAWFVSTVYLKRLACFWMVYAGDFSAMHKVWNVLTLLPLYALSIFAIFRLFFSKHKFLIFYALAVVFSYNLFQAFTMLDFDWRYRIVVFPFLVIMIGCAFRRGE